MKSSCLSCVTCGRPHDHDARYCVGCYTVFPTNSHGSYRFEKHRGSFRAKGGFLAAAAILLTWFWSVDTDLAGAGPVESRAADIKRGTADFVESSAASLFGTAYGPTSREEGHLWHLRTAANFNCGTSLGCEAIVDFGSGMEGRYFLLPGEADRSVLAARDDASEKLLKIKQQGVLEVQELHGSAKMLVVAADGDSWLVSRNLKQDPIS